MAFSDISDLRKDAAMTDFAVQIGVDTSDVQRKLADVESKLAKATADHQARLGGISQSLGNLKNQFGDFSSFVAQLDLGEGRLNALQAAITQVRGNLGGLNADLDKLPSNLSGILGGAQRGGGARVDRTDQFIDAIHRGITDPIGVAVDILKDVVNEIEREIERGEGRIADLSNVNFEPVEPEVFNKAVVALTTFPSLGGITERAKQDRAFLDLFLTEQARRNSPHPRALGGPVFPGGSFLVGERGPEIFVPSTAGTILPNGGFGGGFDGDLGAGIARLTAELARLSAALEQAGMGQAPLLGLASLSDDSFQQMGAALAQVDAGLVATGEQTAAFGGQLDQALESVPEELREVAETLGGALIDSLQNGTSVLAAMEEAGRRLSAQLLQGLLQNEQVRAELGELAGVIENVLTQALNGNIDSWEDLGRVALEVLDAIIAKLLETRQAGSGGGQGGGIFGLIIVRPFTSASAMPGAMCNETELLAA